MIMSDGYGIEQFPNQNKIIITMPQTLETAITTTGMICSRKKELSQTELIAILSVAKMCFTEQLKGEKNDIR